MGIRDLNKLIKPHDVEGQLPLSTFKNFKVAVDGGIWLFANKSVSQRRAIERTVDVLSGLDQNLIDQFLRESLVDFLNRFISEGVTPLWVADGEVRAEKIAAKLRRKKPRDALVLKMEIERERLSKLSPLSRTGAETAELKRLLCQDVRITESDKNLVRGVIIDMGLEFVTAPYDAEFHAVSLCHQKKAKAVWTTDTDAIALGCSVILTGWNGYFLDYGLMVTAIQSKDVLTALNLTQAQFLDLCIILECDFNTRVPKIGPVTALRLIKKHSTIEAIIASDPTKQWSLLNHHRCREIFSSE